MKRMVCEMCGSSDLIKQDGYFVCQNCFTKYSVEEAKKIMVEFDGPVEIKGTVKIDKNFDSILKMGDDAYKSGNYKEAYQYYTQYVEHFPEDYEVKLRRYIAYGSSITLVQIAQLDGLMNYIDEYCACVVKDPANDENVIKAKILSVFAESFVLLNSVYNLIKSIYIDRGIASTSSHGDFLNYSEFVIQRQLFLYSEMEKYLYYCLELEEIWSSQYKIIDRELGYYHRKYKFNDTVFYLTRTGKKKFDEMHSANKNNRSRFPALLEKTKAKIQKDRNDKYWEEHKDLKVSLLAEKESLSKNNDERLSEIKNIESRIEKIKSEHPFDSLVLDKEIEKLNSELDLKKNEKGQLGFFKFKDKSTLKKQIKELESSLVRIVSKKESKMKEHDAEIAKLYVAETEQINKLNGIIDSNNRRDAEIDRILNANY